MTTETFKIGSCSKRAALPGLAVQLSRCDAGLPRFAMMFRHDLWETVENPGQYFRGDYECFGAAHPVLFPVLGFPDALSLIQPGQTIRRVGPMTPDQIAYVNGHDEQMLGELRAVVERWSKPRAVVERWGW